MHSSTDSHSCSFTIQLRHEDTTNSVVPTQLVLSAVQVMISCNVVTCEWGFSHRLGGVRFFDAGVKILIDARASNLFHAQWRVSKNGPVYSRRSITILTWRHLCERKPPTDSESAPRTKPDGGPLGSPQGSHRRGTAGSSPPPPERPGKTDEMTP